VNRRVLFVDDDPNILEAFRRQLIEMCEVETAQCGQEALDSLEGVEGFAAVVTDMRMPEMDGAELLARLRHISPLTVRVMLTGDEGQSAAAEAVNQGMIFRFLRKPCPPDQMAATLEAAFAEHERLCGEREMLEETLKGSIKILVDILSLLSPLAFGRASRIRRLTSELARRLEFPHTWQIEIAAMMSELGSVMLSENLLERKYAGKYLNEDEIRSVNRGSRVALDLLNNVPRLRTVATIIAECESPPSPVAAISITDDSHVADCAQILRVAREFDTLTNSGLSVKTALKEMQRDLSQFDSRALRALIESQMQERETPALSVRIEDLRSHMVLLENVRRSSGVLLIARGQEVTPTLRERLLMLRRRGEIGPEVKVLVRGRISPDSENSLQADRLSQEDDRESHSAFR
jgi:response regulator RpfG family c-di-GMP phosphodiesterase